ncbi:MAG: hypothetical protein E7521_07145 [Ruminococcaceae bacterium]|nr:hypothetical protein [Oscillospiraceae bacterium]
MNNLKEKIKYWLKTIIQFILNPRLLLCFGIAWIITNGWAYITVAISAYFKLEWLAAIAGGYLAALWIPFTPEKIITVIIAIFLLKLLFPNDKKTLEKLHNMKEKAKEEIKKLKIKHKENKDLRDK